MCRNAGYGGAFLSSQPLGSGGRYILMSSRPTSTIQANKLASRLANRLRERGWLRVLIGTRMATPLAEILEKLEQIGQWIKSCLGCVQFWDSCDPSGDGVHSGYLDAVWGRTGNPGEVVSSTVGQGAGGFSMGWRLCRHFLEGISLLGLFCFVLFFL